jgi:peroxiredoxin
MAVEHGNEPDLRTITAHMIERLRTRRSHAGSRDREQAPQFVLPGASGGKVSLEDRLAAGPVVLSFYRGAWCPICNTELTGLQEALPRITSLGGPRIAVSPQAPDASQAFVQRLGLAYEVLSDLDQTVIRAYRLQFELVRELRNIFG